MAKITPEEYEQWLAENRPGWKVLEPYQNDSTPLEHICEKGHPWKVRPSHLKNRRSGRKCPSCKNKNIYLGRPVTPERWDWYLSQDERGFKALEPYAGSMTAILHECSKGHQWKVQPSSIKNQGTHCPHCTGERKGRRVQNSVTLEVCMASASKYDEINKWRKAHPADYSRAHKQGWIDKCTAHMTRLQKPHGYWTLERCKAEAKKYQHRVDWQRSRGGAAYDLALRNGWMEECCAHMTRRVATSDYDAVYVWEIIDDLGPTGIYKVGLTSWKLDDKRIKRVAGDGGLNYRIVALIRTTKGDAAKIENAIKTSGKPFTDLPDTVVDGRTEFRTFTAFGMQTINQLAVMSGYKEAA